VFCPHCDLPLHGDFLPSHIRNEAECLREGLVLPTSVPSRISPSQSPHGSAIPHPGKCRAKLPEAFPEPGPQEGGLAPERVRRCARSPDTSTPIGATAMAAEIFTPVPKRQQARKTRESHCRPFPQNVPFRHSSVPCFLSFHLFIFHRPLTASAATRP
jgi:hypothetical protein